MDFQEKSKKIKVNDSYQIVIQKMGQPISVRAKEVVDEIELDYGTAPMASGPLNVILNARDSTVIRVGPEI